MRSIPRTAPFRTLLVMATLLGATDVFGLTIRSRPLEATVESINLETRTLTIAPAKGKGPSVLTLMRDTTFLHNWKFVPPSDLKRGDTRSSLLPLTDLRKTICNEDRMGQWVLILGSMDREPMEVTAGGCKTSRLGLQRG